MKNFLYNRKKKRRNIDVIKLAAISVTLLYLYNNVGRCYSFSKEGIPTYFEKENSDSSGTVKLIFFFYKICQQKCFLRQNVGNIYGLTLTIGEKQL